MLLIILVYNIPRFYDQKSVLNKCINLFSKVYLQAEVIFDGFFFNVNVSKTVFIINNIVVNNNNIILLLIMKPWYQVKPQETEGNTIKANFYTIVQWTAN